MPKYGRRSKRELSSAHPDLQRLFNEVIKDIDCSVLCGHRGKEDQDRAFNAGKSIVKWPNSNHNKKPSLAVDVVPWPIDWNNMERFKRLAGIVKCNARWLKIRIVCGIDWKRFPDAPHYELA